MREKSCQFEGEIQLAYTLQQQVSESIFLKDAVMSFWPNVSQMFIDHSKSKKKLKQNSLKLNLCFGTNVGTEKALKKKYVGKILVFSAISLCF